MSWVLIFLPGTILLDLCNSIASNNLRKKSFFSHSSVFGVVRAPLFCINSSFSDDPIGFSFVFRNLKFGPKIGFFSPFCLTLQALQNADLVLTVMMGIKI